MQLKNLGTDFDSNYVFVNGDIQLIADEENLIQSITNRLNTKFGSMSAFYTNYGSYLRTYIGDKKNDTLLKFLSVEISTVLRQDPRLQNNFSVDLNYGEDGKVCIYISVVFDDDTDLSLNLVLNDDGMVLI